jgi:hypothetical protein
MGWKAAQPKNDGPHRAQVVEKSGELSQLDEQEEQYAN